jgi:cobalamin biosynthesis protein CobD/CbiB
VPTDRRKQTTVAEDLRAAARVWGVIMLVPGLGFLAVTGWLLLEMASSGVFSFRALLCTSVFGVGLTLGGVSRLLGGRDDEA